jgi:hypothetical protein
MTLEREVAARLHNCGLWRSTVTKDGIRKDGFITVSYPNGCRVEWYFRVPPAPWIREYARNQILVEMSRHLTEGGFVVAKTGEALLVTKQ